MPFISGLSSWKEAPLSVSLVDIFTFVNYNRVMLLLAVPSINREDEVPDADSTHEQDLGEMEKHKSVILHLLSQLKLGMDLTRVSVHIPITILFIHRGDLRSIRAGLL